LRFRRASAGLAATLALAWPGAASAGQPCGHAVIFTLPGVTWEEIGRLRPPALLAAARAGAMGSVSVRTNTARTSYASGFATLGGGARLDGGQTTGGPAYASGRSARNVRVAGIEELRDAAKAASYGAQPGALASALEQISVAAVGNADHGLPPPLPAGLDRWTLLAAMDRGGVVDLAQTGPRLLRRQPQGPYGVRTDLRAIERALRRVLSRDCSVAVVDHGDVTRADAASVLDGAEARSARADALRAADGLLARLRAALDPARDLLVVVSPTSPAWDDDTHLGIAIAEGPGWPAGSELTSASTRRSGIVTLTDVAPTILAHYGISPPPSMTGQPWSAVEARGDRVTAAISLDDESVFVDRVKSPVAAGFVVFQVLVYLAAVAAIGRGRRVPRRALELAALCVVAFPPATYLAGALPAHELGSVAFVAFLVILAAALASSSMAIGRTPLARLIVLTGATTLLLVVDLVSGARLQLNTVFGYSPIVAGRFAGAGNISFAVLAVSALVFGALLVELWRPRVRALAVAAILYVSVVVVDGAPQFGSDVGGVLALVPALGATWLMLSGRRPSPRLWVAGVSVALALVAVFLALDLSRPPEDRTHLARLWLDITDEGAQVVVDTVRRKAGANLRVFTSTFYTFFVPPALAALAWLLLRPRGRWQVLARAYPRVRAGLVGGLVLAVLGFAVNDSGIVIPAVVLSYLVPLALLVHLELHRPESPGPALHRPEPA